MPKSQDEVIREARDLIADKDRWTQGALARDAAGNAVQPNKPGAVCWCAGGALHAVAPLNFHFRRPLVDALHAQGFTTLTGFNDSHTHAEVLALFDEALA